MSPFFNAFSAPRSALHHFGGAAILLRCKCGPNWNYALRRVYDLTALPILVLDRPLRPKGHRLRLSRESQIYTFPLNPPLEKGDLVEEQTLFDRWLQSMVVGD